MYCKQKKYNAEFINENKRSRDLIENVWSTFCMRTNQAIDKRW